MTSSDREALPRRSWRVRAEKKRPWWHVAWLHSTENSSWWSDSIVQAESAQDAAAQMVHLCEEHTRHRDGKRLRVHVYGPIPDDGQEFFVSPSTEVEVSPRV